MHGNYRLFSLDRSRMALAQFVLLASVLASPGSAEPLYKVDLDTSVVSGGAFDNNNVLSSDSNPVSASDLLNLPGATGFASGAAGPGSLAVIGKGNYSVTDPTMETNADGTATAISTIDDLVFPGTGTLNGVFLNLDLSGSMSVSGTTQIGLCSLSLNFKLNNQPSPFGLDGFRTVQLPSFFADTGVLDGVWAEGLTTFNGTIAVGPFDNVPTGVPISLRMGMTINGSVFLFAPSIIGNAASGIGNLGNTMSFSSSGAVFTDSGGPVLVNSVQGSIVNGLWTGSPVSAPPLPEPPPVPALSTGMLFVLALVMGASALLAGAGPAKRYKLPFPGRR